MKENTFSEESVPPAGVIWKVAEMKRSKTMRNVYLNTVDLLLGIVGKGQI